MRANTLNVHIRKHSAARPFECPVPNCSAHYTEKGNLTKHIRTRHQGFEVKSSVGSQEVRVTPRQTKVASWIDRSLDIVSEEDTSSGTMDS